MSPALLKDEHLSCQATPTVSLAETVTLCVLIIDDHELFRAGMALLLKQFHPGSHVMQAATVGAALTHASLSMAVDVVLMDWHLPHEDPVLNCQRVKTQWPMARLVVVSANDAPIHMASLQAIGVSGYISKSASPSAFIAALDAVLQGGVCALLPASGGGSPSAGWAALPSSQALAQRLASGQLTLRQKQVLNALLRGQTNKHIARELDIAEETVKKHLNVVYVVLGVRGRTELVSLLMQGGA